MPAIVDDVRSPVTVRLMKLWALRCGDLFTDVGGLLGGLLGGEPKGVMGAVPVMSFAVDTGDGVLVFDTGIHEACCGPDPAAVLEHHVTGRPTDADEALASLQLLTSLGAEILTAHDIDQWRDVPEASLLHSA